MGSTSTRAVSLVLVLIAASSLVSMLGLYQMDRMINQDLYQYGLRFSYAWAMPYWTIAELVFATGWFNILAAIAFNLYILAYGRKEKQQLEPETKRETRKPETQEAIKPMKEEKAEPEPKPEMKPKETVEQQKEAEPTETVEEKPKETPTQEKKEETPTTVTETPSQTQTESKPEQTEQPKQTQPEPVEQEQPAPAPQEQPKTEPEETPSPSPTAPPPQEQEIQQVGTSVL